MKATNIEERLALVGVLIVLIGVSFAAEDALADEAADTITMDVALHEAAKNTIEIAAEANEDAVASAIEALELENWTDLDIRLDDHSSVLVAELN